MALQCIILLLSVFFSTALALKCYECIPSALTGKCTQVENFCPSQCSSSTTTVYKAGLKQNYSIKTCADSFSCLTGSMNYGESKVTLNTRCCSTDLCNSQNAPELPQRPPNGKSCFTSDKTGALNVLACEGDETQCFTIKVEVDDEKLILKGCSSKLFCGGDGSRVLGRSVGVEAKCCEGNLCNSAQSIRVFLMPLVLLISLLFF